MKFSEKLQKLRKENNLSQEQLADKLDVSRQSVSKWESGQTYPEMDKLLTMCKLFNVTLDDLTNDEININNVKPKNKNTFDNLVDDVMYIIDKTYSMFTNMEPKERGKCIGELIIIFLILLFFRIPFEYLISIGNSLLYYLPINYLFMNLWTFIINTVYLILFVFTFLYIYKTYFLDKYKEKPKEEYKSTETKENKIDINETINEDKEEENKKILKKKDKRQKNHTFGTTLYEILGYIVNFCFKGFLIFISIPFIISFVFITLAFFFLLTLLTKGIIFIGFIICSIAALILNWLLLKLIFSFLFNYKPKFNYMFITFILGISLTGIGTGLSIFNIMSFDYIDEAPTIKFEKISKEVEYDFIDNIIIETHNNPIYIIDESLGNKIKLSTDYYKELSYVDNYEYQNYNYKIISLYINDKFNKHIFNILLDDLKNKNIYNYSKLYENNITISASSENINKLKENYNNYNKERNNYYLEVNYYENELVKKDDELNNLITELDNLNKKVESLEYENQNLKDKINEYKKNLENILGN